MRRTLAGRWSGGALTELLRWVERLLWRDSCWILAGAFGHEDGWASCGGDADRHAGMRCRVGAGRAAGYGQYGAVWPATGESAARDGDGDGQGDVLGYAAGGAVCHGDA